MNSKKDNKPHSVASNIFFMVKLVYSVSPGIIIGGILVYILSVLPSKLVPVIGIKYIIDSVENNEEPMKIIISIALIMLLLVFEACINPIYEELYAKRENERLYLGLNGMLYEKAAKMDLEKYDDSAFYSDFILAIQSAPDFTQNIMWIVTKFIGEVISFISIASIMLTIDPIALLIVLAFVVVFIPVSKYVGNLQVKRRIVITEKHRKGDYFARLFYLPEYVKEIRMNSLTDLLVNRFRESSDDIKKTQKYYIKRLDAAYFTQTSVVHIIGFMFVLVLYIGYRTICAKTLSPSDFIATFNGAVSIGSSIYFLTVYAIRNFTETSKIIEKYRVFLNVENKLSDGENEAASAEPETIELKNVSFTYPGNDSPTLENVSLTIKPKEKIALVGYNGAGKTTLTNLLLRLYDVTDGEILIGGENIKNSTVKSHRNRFAAVFQDFKVFCASVGENISLNTSFDKDRIEKSIQAAGLKKDFPDGINTELLREFSDDGIMLSGGEEQKLTIARAFYKNCPYVIFDEPSANLDPVSEYEFNKAITEAASDKTVIFISHRLSTTCHADRIFMLEKGKIIESGSHDELMKLNGKYAYMFNLQAEKYIANS